MNKMLKMLRSNAILAHVVAVPYFYAGIYVMVTEHVLKGMFVSFAATLVHMQGRWLWREYRKACPAPVLWTYSVEEHLSEINRMRYQQ